MRVACVHVAVQRGGVEAVRAAATCSRTSTSRLRLQKISAFLTSSVRDQAGAAPRACRRRRPSDQRLLDGLRPWSPAARPLISSGLDRKASARRRISGGMVAEKNSVCRACGSRRDDALDIGDEAHVEHAVGLVDDEDLDVGEQDLAALEQVEQAAGRGDQHVDAAIEHASPVVHALAADQQRHGQLGVLAVVLEIARRPGSPARASARGSASAACARAAAAAGAGCRSSAG